MKTYEELLAENEELIAQVEAIAKDRDDWKNAMARAASVLLLHKVPTKNINVDKALAEIKAEAVKEFAGWAFDTCPNIDCMLDGKDDYIAKIRNAGTWLKDSNVNGGKRQGVE